MAPWLLVAALLAAGGPLRLHPANPRYFELGGRPTVLVGSTEHYGAVLNLDFDHGPYLDELRAHRLNLVRVFTGVYVEPPGAFDIQRNTLAPRPGRLIAPWARSATPGYAGGGNKFDLTRWDPAYFRRLKSFVREAGRRGIVVEVVLFCTFYDEKTWALSPLHERNNVNGVGKVGHAEVYTLRDQAVQAIQEALVRKVVTELNELDNVFFEICNEPYFAGVTPAWQRRIADVFVQTQRMLPKRHLLAQNIANGSARVTDPHPAVSIFNFHYATPPTAVAENHDLARPVGDDETGFRGTGDDPYRLEGWDFLLAGGALFDHLDYSFTTEHERGTFALPPTQPGGGGRALRRQLRILVDFMNGLDFVAMKPADVVRGLPEDLSARALVRPGETYAVYVRPQIGRTGDFVARWTGAIEAHAAGEYTFTVVADDGARLWIDDLPVVDDFGPHPEREARGVVRLPARRKVPLRLEYQQGSGRAVVRLLWQGPGVPRQVIPADRLTTPDGQRGLRGEYWTDREFRALALVRVDPAVDFDFTVRSPFVPAGPAGPRRADLTLDLPAGAWRAEWVDTRTGAVRAEPFQHGGGARALTSPPFETDIALRVRRAR